MVNKKLVKILITTLTASFLLSSCGKSPVIDDDDEPYYEGTDPSLILDGYYSELTSWKNYIDLREKLYNIIRKDFAAIPYTSDPEGSGANWSTNRKADQSLTNQDKVHLLYSDKEEYKYNGTSTNWQREHCFPASLLTGQTTGDAVKTIGTATDFHNLYASYSSGNSAHSNMSYGYVDETSPMEIKTAGNAKYQEDNPDTWKYDGVFEPADIDKGRTSRAIFYMAIMYGDGEWVTNTDSAGHTLSTGITLIRSDATRTCTLHEAEIGKPCHSNLEDLIEWNSKFWPDRLELQHTNVVQSLQHNRNPFVDFPELVDYAFGSKMTKKGELKNLHNIYDILDLGNKDTKHVSVKNVKYQYDGGDAFNSSEDLEVYSVQNDLTQTRVTDFEISGVENGQILHKDDNGKRIKVSIGNASVSYNVFVADDGWKDCNYVGKPTYSTVGYRPYDTHSMILNGMEWGFEAGDARSASVLDLNGKEIGVTIGSSGSPSGEISLSTANLPKVGDGYVVKKILVEANTSSKYYGNYACEISLDGKVVYSIDVKHNAISPLSTIGVTLSPLTQGPGKITIKFTGVQTGFNLGRIGLLVDTVSD